jgi:hypothetical protein
MVYTTQRGMAKHGYGRNVRWLRRDLESVKRPCWTEFVRGYTFQRGIDYCMLLSSRQYLFHWLRAKTDTLRPVATRFDDMPVWSDWYAHRMYGWYKAQRLHMTTMTSMLNHFKTHLWFWIHVLLQNTKSWVSFSKLIFCVLSNSA